VTGEERWLHGEWKPVSGPPGLTVSATVLGAPDARSLGGFYRRLLGWDVVADEPDWVMLRPPGGDSGLSFQTEEGYVPPAWPAGPGEQQMMMHLDLRADDLEAACRHAEACGATLAPHQPQDDVRVYLDPAGHPFCLFLPGA
jgi:catechol 2,3-dioxygenase-like lactoylglutathione lyase family enzyme